MSANSVLPPVGGMWRADRSEYLAGTGLNELSECQSWLPSPNRRRRSSRASTLLFLSRLEMSFRSMLTRRSCGRGDVAGRLLERPQAAAEDELLVVVDLLVVEHQHAEPVHAGMDGRDLVASTAGA